jgi:hypothetical protein
MRENFRRRLRLSSIIWLTAFTSAFAAFGQSLSVDDVAVFEGDSGLTPATFTVTLSPSSTQTVSVRFSFSGDSYDGDAKDFVATNGVLNLLPGETNKAVTVFVNANPRFQRDNQAGFYLSEFGVTNASIGRGRGVLTVLNDDSHVFAPLPFCDDWETGIINDMWVIDRGFHRPGVEIIQGIQETRSLSLWGISTVAEYFPGPHEAALGLNLFGYTNVILEFSADCYLSPRTNQLGGCSYWPAPAYSGVYISNDPSPDIRTNPSSAYLVQDLRGYQQPWTDFVVDLDQYVAQAGVAYNTNFLVVFFNDGNVCDLRNGSWSSLKIDNVCVRGRRRTVEVSDWRLVAESCQPPNGIVEQGERVTFSLTLINAADRDFSNVRATLLPNAGILWPNEAQSYGLLSAGGPAVTRQFAFTVMDGSDSQLIEATLLLSDDESDFGTRTLSIPVRKFPMTHDVPNTNRIRFPLSGPAVPFPSTNLVSGISQTVSKVSVTLSNVATPTFGSLSILLAGPHEQKILLMSWVPYHGSVANRTFTFDDDAAVMLSGQPAAFAKYKPTSYNPDPSRLPFPPGPYATNLSVLRNVDPNGPWTLYIYDDLLDGDPGTLGVNGGWLLEFTFVEPVIACAFLSFDGFSFSLATREGANYIVEFTENISSADWHVLERLAGDNTAHLITDSRPEALQRFYRVRTE